MSTKHLKHAEPDHPILDVIANRWSPYVYDGRSVEPDKLRSCLEAARWAASSFNEQPWRFILATRDEPTRFDAALHCLVEANRQWAQHAGALLLTVVKQTFTQNNKPNRVAEHDLGLAAANLTIQAEALGLVVHQMAGINPTQVRQTYGIPEGYEPQTAIAIGYAADPDKAEDQELAERDRQPRSRKPLREFVFAEKWESAADLVT